MLLVAAPRARRRPVGGHDPQRAGAAPAAGRRPAGLTGQAGGVPVPGGLQQHRALLQAGTDRVEGLLRQACGARERVALQVEVGVSGDRHLGAALPEHLPGRHHLAGPAGPQQQLALRRTREAADQRGAALLVGPLQQHLAGVQVGRVRLGVQVVTVVPDRDQAQVLHGGERRGAGPDHDLHRTAGDGEEGAVALGRAEVRGQRDVMALPQRGPQRRVDAGDVAVVGHAQQRPAARGVRRGDRLGQQRRPVLPGSRRPHRPGTPAVGQVTHERPAAHVGRPLLLRRGRVHRGGGRRCRGLLLHRGVSRGHRQPEHVGAGAGVASGDGGGQRRDPGGEHRLGAHHPTQRHQPARVGALRHARQHEPVDVLPGEAHLDPRPRDGGGRHLLRHQVVEGPVQVREGHVDEDLGDRVDLGRVDGRPGCGVGLGLRRALLRRPGGLPGTGQLGHQLRLLLGVGTLGVVHARHPPSGHRHRHASGRRLWRLRRRRPS